MIVLRNASEVFSRMTKINSTWLDNVVSKYYSPEINFLEAGNQDNPCFCDNHLCLDYLKGITQWFVCNFELSFPWRHLQCLLSYPETKEQTQWVHSFIQGVWQTLKSVKTLKIMTNYATLIFLEVCPAFLAADHVENIVKEKQKQNTWLLPKSRIENCILERLLLILLSM